MSCVEVRELLPDLAMGALPERDRTRVEQHLRWCAGCRKESTELETAAATLAFALKPAPLPPELGDRVTAVVREAAGVPGSGRRARASVALAVAAMVTVAALGWGAAMAGRAERFADQAAAAEARRSAALKQFDQVLSDLVPRTTPSTDETHLGQLAPTAGRLGGGAVLQLVSPTRLDFVIVLVNGLDPHDSALPYTVTVHNAADATLRIGRIRALDQSGGADAYRQFEDRDLTGFTTVEVRNAAGEVVLSGTVDQGGL